MLCVFIVLSKTGKVCQVSKVIRHICWCDWQYICIHSGQHCRLVCIENIMSTYMIGHCFRLRTNSGRPWASVRIHVTTVTSHPSLVTPTCVYSQSRPHLNSPWPNPNPSQVFPIHLQHSWTHLQHSRSGEHHSRTHLTIPNKPKTSWIPSTNPELGRSPLNPKTQYAQPQSGEAQMLSIIPDWVLFLFFCTYYYPSLLTLASFLLSLLSSINPVSI